MNRVMETLQIPEPKRPVMPSGARVSFGRSMRVAGLREMILTRVADQRKDER